MPIIAAVGISLAFNFSRYVNISSPRFSIGIGAISIGWLTLVYSKWEQIKESQIIKFGVSSINRKKLIFYKLSYLLMIAGYLVATFSDL